MRMAQKEEEEDHPFPFMQEQQEQSGERNSVSSSSSRNLQQLKLGWVNRHQSNVRHLQFLMPYGIRYNEINHTHQPSFSQVQMASSSSSSSITQDSSEVENLASRMESLTFSNLNAFHGYHEPCLQCVRNIHSANATLPTRHHHHHHHHHRRLHAIGVWLSMAKDPRGSRVVQQKIDEGTRQENFHIVKELEHHFHELIKHPYGSFVILKLFQSRNITVAQKNYFIYLITTDLSMLRDLCIHDLGGRVIQQILEIEDVLIAIDQITYAMSRVTVALMKNNNGGYVILQCLKVFPPEHKNVILEVVARNCYDIAVNKSGCCSIQKVIQHDDVPGFYALIDNLISNAENLAKDQYGNYVVQFLVKKNILEVNAMLVSELQYKFVGLSTDKYASNVVEDLLHYSRTEYAAIIVEEIMESPNFIQVVQDQYGNYVLQRALQYTEGLLYESLRAIILSNRDKLSSCLHGKKVLNVAQKGK